MIIWKHHKSIVFQLLTNHDQNGHHPISDVPGGVSGIYLFSCYHFPKQEATTCFIRIQRAFSYLFLLFIFHLGVGGVITFSIVY